MAYNNLFPMNYPQAAMPQYYGQNMPNMGDYGRTLANTQPMQNGSQGDFRWVQGEAAAKSYPVAPNSKIALWDSEANVIYIKTADINGIPSMTVIDYTVRGEQRKNELLSNTPQIDTSKFVTREEFNSRLAQLVSHETSDEKVVAVHHEQSNL